MRRRCEQKIAREWETPKEPERCGSRRTRPTSSTGKRKTRADNLIEETIAPSQVPRKPTAKAALKAPFPRNIGLGRRHRRVQASKVPLDKRMFRRTMILVGPSGQALFSLRQDRSEKYDARPVSAASYPNIAQSATVPPFFLRQGGRAVAQALIARLFCDTGAGTSLCSPILF